MRVFRWHFDGTEDFFSAIEMERFPGKATCIGSRGGQDRGGQNKRWYGGVTWDETHDLAARGWPEGLDRAEKLKAQLVESIVGSWQLRPKVTRSVCGFAPCVPAAVAGDPESMLDLRREMAPGAGKIVSIVYNVTVSACFEPETLIQRGAIVLALIDLLESAGRRCEVTVCTSLAPSWLKSTHCEWFVKLKEPDQQPQMDALAFWIGHPAAYRRFMFSLWENTTPETISIEQMGSYGNIIEVAPERQGDIYINSALLGNVDEKTAVPFIRNQLARIGVEFAQ